MTPDEPSPAPVVANSKRRKHRWWRWILIPLAVVLIPILVVLAVKEYRYRREIGLMRAEGLPTSLEELEAWRGKLKPEEDATELWLSAIAEWEQVKDVASPKRPGSTPGMPAEATPLPFVALIDAPIGEMVWPGEDWPDLPVIEKYLEQFQPMMEFVWKASDKGGLAHFPVHLELKTWFDSPKAIVRKSVWWIQLSCLVDLHRGEVDRATRSFCALCGLCQDRRSGGFLLDFMVRADCTRSAAQLLPTLLSVPHFPEPALDKIEERLKAIDPHRQLQDALIADAVWLLHEKPSMTFFVVRNINNFFELPWYFVRDDVLADARQRLVALRQPSPESFDPWDTHTRRQQPAYARAAEFLGYDRVDLRIDFSKIEASMSASVRMMRVALHLRRYWQANHHLPIDLSDITGLPSEITIDPFTGSEFAIRHKNEHTIDLISAGDDEEIAEDTNDSDDVVIELKMPK